MEIQPATLDQVRTGRDGRRVVVEDDVGCIAKQIGEIDPRLGLRWNERGEFFMVVETDGTDERLVTTATELDGRLVERLRKITSPGYDFAGEVERMDRDAKAKVDDRFSERVGEAGEKAAHALRKDLGVTNRAFVSRDVG